MVRSARQGVRCEHSQRVQLSLSQPLQLLTRLWDIRYERHVRDRLVRRPNPLDTSLPLAFTHRII